MYDRDTTASANTKGDGIMTALEVALNRLTTLSGVHQSIEEVLCGPMPLSKESAGNASNAPTPRRNLQQLADQLAVAANQALDYATSIRSRF